VSTLANVASRTGSFRLRYRRLVATNSAVIVVADEPNHLSALATRCSPARPGRDCRALLEYSRP